MLPLCGNGVLDDGEVCDGDVGDATCAGLEGFSGGTLACAEDCLSYDTTGCELENTPTCAAGVRLNEVCHKDSKWALKAPPPATGSNFITPPMSKWIFQVAI